LVALGFDTASILLLNYIHAKGCISPLNLALAKGKVADLTTIRRAGRAQLTA